jgi:hypothetical protein
VVLFTGGKIKWSFGVRMKTVIEEVYGHLWKEALSGAWVPNGTCGFITNFQGLSHPKLCPETDEENKPRVMNVHSFMGTSTHSSIIRIHS